MSYLHTTARLLVVLVILLLVSAFAPQLQAAETDQLVPLYVKAGTNLTTIARTFCRSQDDWHAIARINHLKSPYLIIEDSYVQVPMSLLQLYKLTITVGSVHGQVSRVDGNTLVPLKPGDTLLPGQTVATGEHGYTHLLLPNRTYTRLDPDSQFTINYLLQLKDGSVKADFSLDKGEIIHWVREKLKQNETFRTHTPVALTGIRGTQFRLKTIAGGANNVETLQGRVEVTSSGKSTMVQPNQGVRVQEGQPPEQPRPLPQPPAKPVLVDLYRSLPVIIPAPAHPTAQYIRLRITQDQQGQATLFDQKVAPKDRFVVVNLPDGHLTASLTAIDKDNFESQVTGPLPFNVRTTPPTPVISSPKAGSTLWGKQGTIEWLESDQVAHYEAQLASDAGFTQIINADNTLTKPSYTSPELPPGTYYFRVKTVAPDGYNTLYSTPIMWKLAPAPKMGKMEGTANKRPTLQWSAMAPEWTYDLQVGSDKQFTKLVVDCQGLTTTSYTLEDLLAPGKYWVHIRGVENGKPVSPWTPAQTLTIKHKPLGWIEAFFGVVTFGMILL